MSLKRSEPHVSENPEIRQDQVECSKIAAASRRSDAADGDFKLTTSQWWIAHTCGRPSARGTRSELVIANQTSMGCEARDRIPWSCESLRADRALREGNRRQATAPDGPPTCLLLPNPWPRFDPSERSRAPRASAHEPLFVAEACLPRPLFDHDPEQATASDQSSEPCR